MRSRRELRPAPPSPPGPVVARFPARIVDQPPLANAKSASLNVQALKTIIRPSRRCGPREIARSTVIGDPKNAGLSVNAVPR